jgi:tRNA(Ile)-lysidine synthase
MAVTPTPRPTPADSLNPAANPAAIALAGWQASPPLAVAYSGGADSTALLLACAARWPGQIHAIHIHHGLQAAADGFARHCEGACAALGVPLQVVHVDARHASGESPEDAARKARYAALADAARHCGAQEVLLAQHADDQAETLLLALSRGAGLPGLAAMPARFERHGMAFGRPLLGVSGQAIRAWLASQHIVWVDDPSNANTAYTRNRIRHGLLPAIAQAFPQFRETFARSARHAAQAQALLDELAALDLQAAGEPPAIAALRALSRERQGNALRYWLRRTHGTAATAAQLDELLDQLQACTTRGHRIRIKVGTGFVERAGERLAFIAPV